MKFSTISGILNAPGVPDQESYAFWPAVRTSHTYFDQRYTTADTLVTSGTALLSSGSQKLCSPYDTSQWCFLWDVPPCFASGFRPLLLWFSFCPPVIFILSSSQNTTFTVSVLEFICCSKQHCVLSLSSHFFSAPCERLHHSLPPRILLPTHSHFYCLLDALSSLVLDISASIVLSVVLHHGFPYPSHSACLSIVFDKEAVSFYLLHH